MDTHEQLKGKTVRLLLREPLDVGGKMVMDISGTWGGIQGPFFSLNEITHAMNREREDVTDAIPKNSLILGNYTAIAYLLSEDPKPAR